MGLRFLHVIRHGHYITDESDAGYGRLTEIGWRQSECLARALVDLPVTAIEVSTLARARQTAEALVGTFSRARVHYRHILREIIPAATREHVESSPTLRGLLGQELTAVMELEPKLRLAFDAHFGDLVDTPVERERALSAARHLFRPWGRRADRHELVVSHGNLIRFLVCAVLNAPRENWLNLEIHHCSVTRLAVHPDGSVTLESYNETGHLPEDLRTTA